MIEFEEGIAAARLAESFYRDHSSVLKSIWSDLKIGHLSKAKSSYTKYLSSALDHYALAKPAIIGTEPCPIYRFFEPVHVRLGESTTITNMDFQELIAILPRRRAVITGQAGAGKSILMRHLFISSAIQGSKVPIFVELRKVNNGLSLIELLSGALAGFSLDLGPNTSRLVASGLKRGSFAIFFDGYDEVDPEKKDAVTVELLEMSMNAPDCDFIVSSRPDETTQSWTNFSNIVLQPLTREQAIAIIKKLPFDKLVGDRFCKELDKKFFKRHHEFVSNPLLLVILLVTYSRSALIPENLIDFYQHAFNALFYLHDASKELYKRKRHTDLGMQEFEKLFAAFCIRTYVKSQFEFTASEIVESIQIAKRSVKVEVSVEDYLKDLQSSVSLVVLDGLVYVFSHRSFQEYFAAKYIRQASSDVQEILLNKSFGRWQSDKVYPLLWQMDSSIVQKKVLVPKLDELFLDLGIKKKPGKTHYFKLISQICEGRRVDAYVRPDKHKEVDPASVTTMLGKYFDIVNFVHSCIDGKIVRSFELMHHYAPILDILDAYGTKTGKHDFLLSDMSYRAPLIKMFAESDSIYSFDAFMRMWEYRQEIGRSLEVNDANTLELIAD